LKDTGKIYVYGFPSSKKVPLTSKEKALLETLRLSDI